MGFMYSYYYGALIGLDNDPVLVAGFHQVRKALFDEGQGCRRILGLYIEDGSLWGLYPGLRVL